MIEVKANFNSEKLDGMLRVRDERALSLGDRVLMKDDAGNTMEGDVGPVGEGDDIYFIRMDLDTWHVAGTQDADE